MKLVVTNDQIINITQIVIDYFRHELANKSSFLGLKMFLSLDEILQLKVDLKVDEAKM